MNGSLLKKRILPGWVRWVVYGGLAVMVALPGWPMVISLLPLGWLGREQASREYAAGTYDYRLGLAPVSVVKGEILRRDDGVVVSYAGGGCFYSLVNASFTTGYDARIEELMTKERGRDVYRAAEEKAQALPEAEFLALYQEGLARWELRLRGRRGR